MSDERGEARRQPHSIEAERALIGALLIDPIRVAEATEVVHADDFFDARLGHLYAVLVRLAEQNTPIDFVTVAEELRSTDKLEDLGGTSALVSLSEAVTSSAHLMHHASMVADTSTLRALISQSTNILTKAYDTRPVGEDVQSLLDESEVGIFNVSRKRRGEGAAEISDILTETFRRIDARGNREGLTGVPTGFYDLDDMTSGLNKGDLVIVAARPAMGKTAFALSIMENAAMSQPEWMDGSPSVLLCSLEMGRISLVERMLCSRARVEGHRLRMGRLSGEERADMTDAADDLRRAKIFIDDSPSLTLMSLRSRARRLKATHGLDLILIDYLQLLTWPGAESRQQEISNISRSLKGLARELDLPVIALAQLSRQVEQRDPPRPQLSDLRESGSIEQDADVVMLLYRPEYYLRQRGQEDEEGAAELRGVAEIILSKHRNGPTGTVKLQFFQNFMRFENRELGVAEPIS